MQETLEIHARLEGVPVRIINEIIKSGKAANKTEALRVALLDYEHHHPHSKFKKSDVEEEEKFYDTLVLESNKSVWDNPKEDEAEKWYEKQIKKGAYDEYQEK